MTDTPTPTAVEQAARELIAKWRDQSVHLDKWGDHAGAARNDEHADELEAALAALRPSPQPETWACLPCTESEGRSSYSPVLHRRGKHCPRTGKTWPSPQPEREYPGIEIVTWLRGMGYHEAANAIAELHVEYCALVGRTPEVYVDAQPASSPPSPARTEDTCVHGHTSKRVGCVSCELLWQRSTPAPPDAARVANMLRDIGESLRGAGVNGGTIHGGVLELIRDRDATLAEVERLRGALRVECTCRVIEKCERCEAVDAALASQGKE